MGYRRLLLLAVAGLAMSLPASRPIEWTISLRGTGPVRLGMTLPQVRKTLKDPSASLRGNEPNVPLDACAYLESKALPDSLGIMFAKGRVVRVEVHEGAIRTEAGAKIGDSEERIKQLYPGRITVEPHHYLPEEGHYLEYAAGERYGMVFETFQGKVTSFRAGTMEAIALVEGCS